MALLGRNAVLVCDVTESSFEVTAVAREGDRLVLLGDRTETPSIGAGRPGGDATPLTVIGLAMARRAGCGQAATSPARSVGPCSTRACRASRSSTSSCPGQPLASGGSSRRPRRRADSTGYWRCLIPLHGAPRTWPWPPRPSIRPTTPATPQSGLPSMPEAPRSLPGMMMRGWSRRRAHPAAGPPPAAAPWLPPPAAAAPSTGSGPRRHGSYGRGGGRARRCRGHRRGCPVRSVVTSVAQRRSRAEGTSCGRAASSSSPPPPPPGRAGSTPRGVRWTRPRRQPPSPARRSRPSDGPTPR